MGQLVFCVVLCSVDGLVLFEAYLFAAEEKLHGAVFMSIF